MNIPAEAKQKWQSLKQHGDIAMIESESGINRDIIGAAFRGEECTMDVFTAIQEFYNKRQATINNLINPQEPAKA